MLDYSTVTLVDGQVNVGIQSDKEIVDGRRRADALAKSILEEYKEEAREATIRDFEILKCLKLWKFNRNTSRKAVMPKNNEFVYSDSLGLSRSPSRPEGFIKYESLQYPHFTQLLTLWAVQHVDGMLGLPDDVFPFQCINVNYDYAARMHRDRANVGPSMIKTLGNFTGGGKSSCTLTMTAFRDYRRSIGKI